MIDTRVWNYSFGLTHTAPLVATIDFSSNSESMIEVQLDVPKLYEELPLVESAQGK